jgi:FkbM family methyltransferase
MNVGQTMLKYWSLGLTGRTYYGFEPNPSAVSYLYRLVRENGASNVHIIPAGLSDHTGIASFFMKTEYDPGASAVAGFRQADQYSIERYIAVFKGDDVIAGLNIAAISMLKIDVEGGELEVLVGLESTISRTRPFISCEVLPIRDESTEIGKMRRQRADHFNYLVDSQNYAICRVLKKGGGIELLDRIPTHDDLDLCDYLFIPKENLEAVLNRLKPGTANRAAQAAE